jgi:PIN domain nuclease of toxin-antitoxin system
LKYLLDTHTLIWYATDAPQLSATARALIEDPNNDILISPASIWEIAIKVSIGKLALNRAYKDFLDLCLGSRGFQLLPVEPSHTTIVSSLPFPPRHKDPFDRLLIAQAIIESIPIVSVDLAFDSYAVQRIW